MTFSLNSDRTHTLNQVWKKTTWEKCRLTTEDQISILILWKLTKSTTLGTTLKSTLTRFPCLPLTTTEISLSKKTLELLLKESLYSNSKLEKIKTNSWPEKTPLLKCSEKWMETLNKSSGYSPKLVSLKTLPKKCGDIDNKPSLSTLNSPKMTKDPFKLETEKMKYSIWFPLMNPPKSLKKKIINNKLLT